MARPCKKRRVGCRPKGICYKPAGVPARELKQVEISFDELEAIRLVDGLGCYQEKAAEKMDISRATIGRLLVSGRKKIANAFVDGHGIVFQGGNIEIVDGRD